MRHSAKPKDDERLCLTGAKVGDYDFSQCRVCWRQLNETLDTVLTAEQLAALKAIQRNCCGKDKEDGVSI